MDCAATTRSKAILVAADISFDHVSGCTIGIVHFPVEFAAKRLHTAPILDRLAQRLIGDWVHCVNFLGPGHDAATDKRAFEGAVISQHFRLIIAVSQMGMHGKRAITTTAHLVDALTVLRSVQEASLVLEHVIFPRLARVHVLRERTNVIFVLEHANT